MRTRGFTLIEILVVLFIIGITLSFATLSFGGNDAAERLQRSAQRLQAVIDIAQQDAVLFGEEIGLDLTRKGYRFLRLKPDGWRVIRRNTTPLHPRTLPDGMTLRLLQSQDADETMKSLAPEAPDNEDAEHADTQDEEAGPRPEVLFLSSGTTLPFELVLLTEGADVRYVFKGKRSGKITMHRKGLAGS